MYKRVLLKLSGEALSSGSGPFDFNIIDDVASQIKTMVNNGVQVGIVVGGGNICRGHLFEKLGLDREQSDYIGMQATVMNARVLEVALQKQGIKAKTLTAFGVQGIDDYDVETANKLLAEGYTLCFGGGTGKPFFSTDTASALRAQDMKAEVILIAKNGTDGVYDKDPNKYADAVRFEEMHFSDIIDLKLQVIDLAAAEICRDNKIDAFVFDMAGENNIVKAALGEATGTVIK